MQVHFYGVRGSTPSAGAEFIKYGGNTACVHVCLSDGTDLILDAGTGIKKLGMELGKKRDDIYLLLSHNHWDHIQGFPFFAPAFQNNRKIIITPGQTTPFEPEAILNQMSGSWFPINKTALLADISIDVKAESTHSWHIGSATIHRRKMNHPGSGSSYLIEDNGIKVAYITDNELFPPEHAETEFEQWCEFIQGADLLIHDAQYIQQDMPLKHGWGHSIIDQTLMLALTANVKRCALYSHDHTRNDAMVDEIESNLKQVIKDKKSPLILFAAQEGMTIPLT